MCICEHFNKDRAKICLSKAVFKLVSSGYASDEGFLSYLNSLKDSLDSAENTTDLESRLTEAKNGIDTYYAENVTLSSDGEAPADEK